MNQKARYTRSKKKDNFMTIAGMRRDRYFRALPGIAPNAGAIELPARPLVRSVKNIDWLIKGRVRTKVTRLTLSETKDAKPPKSRVNNSVSILSPALDNRAIDLEPKSSIFNLLYKR
jgi:hypothetical protein